MRTSEIKVVTAIAPSNIAIIKYWGKADEDLIIPLNDSASITLNTDQMRACTTVACSPKFKTDRLWLNGREEQLNKRVKACLEQIRGTKREQEPDAEEPGWCVHICSENNFPTAAGLASSAAGYAALVKALATLYGLKGELSVIARQGSGSACRSIYGGFVQWKRGIQDDGTDCYAVQLAPKEHWPQLRLLILVVCSNKKSIGSTEGMKRSYQTSKFLEHRWYYKLVDEKVDDLKWAIEKKNFGMLAGLAMQESNQLHAICRDTYPPCFYMNDTSDAICEFVHKLNDFLGSTRVAYTFDAGPNAFLLCEEQDVGLLGAAVKHYFPPANANDPEFTRGLPLPETSLPQELTVALALPVRTGALQFIMCTEPGDGATEVDNQEMCLLNAEGEPKSCS